MTTYYCILTQVGAAKLANATALGQTLAFTHMAIGDGGGALPTPNQSQTSLIHEVRRAALNAVEIDPDNPNWIVCEQVLPANVGGWTIRETGVYDVEGDLVAVGNFPETYKPVLEEGSGRTQTIRMVIQVSNAATVTLKIDPAVVLATREYVDDAQAAAEEHADSGDAATLNAAKSYSDQKEAQHVSASDPHPQYNVNLVGAVQAFAAPSPPSGWLKANGSQISRISYASLFDVIGTTFGEGDGATTFNLPDLRGEFIRGWDDGRGVDRGREFASFQSSDNKSHSHGMGAAGNHSHSVTFYVASSNGGKRPAGFANVGSSFAKNTSASGNHTHSIHSSGGSESRPRSVALLYCIKY